MFIKIYKNHFSFQDIRSYSSREKVAETLILFTEHYCSVSLYQVFSVSGDVDTKVSLYRTYRF